MGTSISTAILFCFKAHCNSYNETFECSTTPLTEIFDYIRNLPEDMQTFIDLLSDKQLMDTYLSLRDEFSGPMMMTNQSVSILPDGTRQVTYSRIDRAHHTPLLEGHILIDTLYTKYKNTNLKKNPRVRGISSRIPKIIIPIRRKMTL